MSASNKSSETVQGFTNRSVKFTSPKASALGSASSVNKDSAVANQGGQQLGIALTDQNEGLASGVKSKITGLPIPHITSIQPLNEMYSSVQCANTGMHV